MTLVAVEPTDSHFKWIRSQCPIQVDVAVVDCIPRLDYGVVVAVHEQRFIRRHPQELVRFQQQLSHRPLVLHDAQLLLLQLAAAHVHSRTLKSEWRETAEGAQMSEGEEEWIRRPSFPLSLADA